MKGICLFYFLSIPNGPAGLLVSVNEEPVHAIGILLFSFFHWHYILKVGKRS